MYQQRYEGPQLKTLANSQLAETNKPVALSEKNTRIWTWLTHVSRRSSSPPTGRPGDRSSATWRAQLPHTATLDQERSFEHELSGNPPLPETCFVSSTHSEGSFYESPIQRHPEKNIKRSKGTERAASSTSSLSHPRVLSFTKRPRRKTKPDKYAYQGGKAEGVNISPKKSKSKRAKYEPKSRPSHQLLDNFSSNAVQTARVSVKPTFQAGLFMNGRVPTGRFFSDGAEPNPALHEQKDCHHDNRDLVNTPKPAHEKALNHCQQTADTSTTGGNDLVVLKRRHDPAVTYHDGGMQTSPGTKHMAKKCSSHSPKSCTASINASSGLFVSKELIKSPVLTHDACTQTAWTSHGNNSDEAVHCPQVAVSTLSREERIHSHLQPKSSRELSKGVHPIQCPPLPAYVDEGTQAMQVDGSEISSVHFDGAPDTPKAHCSLPACLDANQDLRASLIDMSGHPDYMQAEKALPRPPGSAPLFHPTWLAESPVMTDVLCARYNPGINPTKSYEVPDKQLDPAWQDKHEAARLVPNFSLREEIDAAEAEVLEEALAKRYPTQTAFSPGPTFDSGAWRQVDEHRYPQYHDAYDIGALYVDEDVGRGSWHNRNICQSRHCTGNCNRNHQYHLTGTSRQTPNTFSTFWRPRPLH